MIPSVWDPVHRPEDGELVGYLVPDDDGLVVPTTLAGTPAGAAGSPATAAGLLVASGLARLARRWWCRLPDPLPPGLLDAGEPAAHWDWRPVVLVEASPDGCRVRPEAPTPEEGGAQATLPVPAGPLLREQPPG